MRIGTGRKGSLAKPFLAKYLNVVRRLRIRSLKFMAAAVIICDSRITVQGPLATNLAIRVRSNSVVFAVAWCAYALPVAGK
jgi:hypothetical protein